MPAGLSDRVDWLEREERDFLLAGCAPPQEKEREEEEEEERRGEGGGRYDEGKSGDAVKHGGGDGVRTLKTWRRGRGASSSISCFCC